MPKTITSKPPKPVVTVWHPTPGEVDRQTRLRAAAVLEVLAGERTPANAAQALGMTLPRYYMMEAQALRGLAAACTAKPRGRNHKLDGQIAHLERENLKLKQTCARLQTLIRAAQRSVGLPPVPKPTPGSAGDPKRKRKPTVRALRVAVRLQSEAAVPATDLLPPAPPPVESTDHVPSARAIEPGRAPSGP